MASDWIRQKAEQEAKQAADSARHQEAQLRKNELIKALGPGLVRTLMNIINDDIVAWNANFKDRQINGATEIQDGFRLEKAGSPRGSADVTFNSNTLRIEVFMQRSTAMGDSMYDHRGFFHLEANSDGKEIHMEDQSRRAHVTAGGFSHIILESIAEPMSSHLF